jgi:hypothetical protein
MSQQINLLAPKESTARAALWPLAGLVVLVLGLLAYLQSIVAETGRLSAVATASGQQLDKAKASLLLLQTQKGKQGDPVAIKADIAALRPQAEAVSQLMKELRSGSLGSSEGFGRYYRALGSVSEDGLWITSVSVSRGGMAMSVNGRALNNDSVMRYARRLNEAFAPFGVRFNSLELTPEALAAPGAPPAATLRTYAFKLS